MFGIDCHTHSGNSPDGTGTVGGLCRRAISMAWKHWQLQNTRTTALAFAGVLWHNPHAMMKKNTAITNAWKKR